MRKQRVNLGKATNPLSDRNRVPCYYFPNFMVKEVDLGEVGAERLGIVPGTPQSTGKCVRARSKEEIVIAPKEWSGYFMGVKNGYLFFSGDDGWNGATPFAIFDSKTGKKLFEDSAKADIAFIGRPDQSVGMQYLRVVSDDCFILMLLYADNLKAAAHILVFEAHQLTSNFPEESRFHGHSNQKRKPIY